MIPTSSQPNTGNGIDCRRISGLTGPMCSDCQLRLVVRKYDPGLKPTGTTLGTSSGITSSRKGKHEATTVSPGHACSCARRGRAGRGEGGGGTVTTFGVGPLSFDLSTSNDVLSWAGNP